MTEKNDRLRKTDSGKDTFIQSFPDLLKSSFGENLLSVMLYGSYVRGGFVKKVSDINVLIIVQEPDPAQLEAFGRSARRIMRRNRITPLILTRQEFNNSADVFPMEYFDIRDRNRVIHGVDETESLSLTIKNLRHQIEDRLRGEIASLRQLLIVARGRKRVLRQYLKLWAGSLNTVFRGLLRLKRTEPIPADHGDILAKIKQTFDIDTSPFNKLNRMRGGQKLEPVPLSHALLQGLGELIRIVDKMNL
ncbi:MAG TPA: nucleotidyltransferase domain-containing protein [Spirochaetota bacterium]|nr:nucleotidyltransferase domain-containing protein [Spirochaetota bacterium]